jgi:hypothetical protein
VCVLGVGSGGGEWGGGDGGKIDAVVSTDEIVLLLPGRGFTDHGFPGGRSLLRTY